MRRRRNAAFERYEPPAYYLFNLGRVPVVLNGVEFRILRFLASRPYYPFTRRKIVEAVSTESSPVTEDSLRLHIRSLRSKLGMFRDYVQTVPFIGYRFKA